MTATYSDYAKMIDHALLLPTTTVEQLEAGCRMARDYDVASVCMLPWFVKYGTLALAGSTVLPSTVIGFPHGGQSTTVKLAEAQQAVADGCQELDMVVNISQVLSGNWDYVQFEISGIVEIAHDADRKVKVIFENCYLEDDHKIRLCEICTEAGADWVKTSTGFGTGGATHDDLRLMVANTPDAVQVKAAGGVRDFAGLKAVREIGASRCGASATKAILDGCREELGLDPIESSHESTAGGY